MSEGQLVRLLYVSCAQTNEDGVRAILSSAERRNPLLGITGGLLYTGQYFFQTLEGPAETVDGMFGEICADPRHHSHKTLKRFTIPERAFTEWAMGYTLLPLIDQLIAPLFVTKDVERSHIISMMSLQALRHPNMH